MGKSVKGFISSTFERSLDISIFSKIRFFGWNLGQESHSDQGFFAISIRSAALFRGVFDINNPYHVVFSVFHDRF
jgi:hypothetical protein